MVRNDGVESGAKDYKQHADVSVLAVQELQDAGKSHIKGIIYRPIGCLCKLQRASVMTLRC